MAGSIFHEDGGSGQLHHSSFTTLCPVVLPPRPRPSFRPRRYVLSSFRPSKWLPPSFTSPGAMLFLKKIPWWRTIPVYSEKNIRPDWHFLPVCQRNSSPGPLFPRPQEVLFPNIIPLSRRCPSSTSCSSMIHDPPHAPHWRWIIVPIIPIPPPGAFLHLWRYVSAELRQKLHWRSFRLFPYSPPGAFLHLWRDVSAELRQKLYRGGGQVRRHAHRSLPLPQRPGRFGDRPLRGPALGESGSVGSG